MTNLLQIIFNPKYILAGITITLILYSFLKSHLAVLPQTIMKQDVNLKLVISSIFIMLLFVGSSIYYTLSLSDISSKQNLFEKEFSIYKQKLADIILLKTRLEEGKNNLEQKYQSIRDTNEELSKKCNGGYQFQNI